MREDNEQHELEPANKGSSDVAKSASESVPDDSTIVSSKLVTNKGSKRRVWIAVGALMIILLIAAVVAYYLLSQHAAKNKEATQPTKFASTTNIINDIDVKLDGTILHATNVEGLGGKTEEGYAAFSFPVYEVPGKNYLTTPTTGEGQGVLSDEQTATENYTALRAFFAEHHFTALDTNDGNGIPAFLSGDNDVKLASYGVYESDDKRCVIWRMDVSKVLPGNNVTSVGCANKSDYKKMADDLQPFATAYGKDKTISKLVFGPSSTSEGTDGYVNASVYQEVRYSDKTYKDIEGARGFYYKAPATDQWKVFSMSRGLLACADFADDVAKKAFHGLDCYDVDGKKESTVQ